VTHDGYCISVMKTALGLIGIVAFIVGVIGFAAFMTWLVVKLSPAGSPKPKPDEG
jgi:hypothetical protein